MVITGKIYGELFIFNILSVCFSLVDSNFNVEEIYGVKYGFEISREPVLLKESSELGNTMLLSSKHGQQYQCVLPELENFDKKDEDIQHISKDEIPQLLEPLKKKCLYNNKGWWTYEVCFGKGIYQYHMEANEVVGDKISLGMFSNETDWSQEKIDLKEKPKPGKSSVATKYHSQYYVNGTECDLTGKRRETQIKIFCDEDRADFVVRVDEPSSCSYVITVHTNKLCKHNLFRSSPAQEPQHITCSPALSEERYKIYVDRVESRKKAKEEAKAAREAKDRARKARAAEKIEGEDEIEEDDEEEVLDRKKTRSKRSQVWPWENPGVESEDEVWIDGNIEQDKIDIHRLDITKGRKKNAMGHLENEGITIMSQKIHRKRQPIMERQNRDAKEKEENPSEDEMKETWDKEKRKEPIEGKEISGEKEGSVEGNEVKRADEVATEQNSEQGIKGEEGVSEEEGKAKDIDVASKEGGKETTKTEQGLDEEWKNKVDEAILKLRSTLKEKLNKLGVKPEVLDKKFEEKLGSVKNREKEGEKADKYEGKIIAEKEDDFEAEDEDENTQQKEQQKSKPNMKSFVESLKGFQFFSGGMLKEFLEVAFAKLADLEEQFEEDRAQMKSEFEIIKKKIQQIKETEETSGVKDEERGKIVSKIKGSIDRFEKTNLLLDDDMQSIKELSKEMFRMIKSKDKPAAKSDLLELALKTNRLFKKILLRRFQLYQEVEFISKISGDKEDEEVLKLRSTMKEKLNKLGVKPEVFDKELEEELGSVGNREKEGDIADGQVGAEKYEGEIVYEKGDTFEDEDEDKDKDTQQKEQQKSKPNSNSFAESLKEFQKLFSGGMMKEFLEATSAVQAELEEQFDEERARMKSEVEIIKTKIQQIEETEETNGVKDEERGKALSKIKDSIERFEKTNLQLDDDMQSIKELNKEITSMIKNRDKPSLQGDLLELYQKTDKLLKKIHLRRFQLDQDLDYITKMRGKISGDKGTVEESMDDAQFMPTKGGIDKVVNKLKTMIQDLNINREGNAKGADFGDEGSAETKPASSIIDDVDELESSESFDESDTKSGVRVKVSKIKKVIVGDDEDSEMEEADLDDEEMEELGLQKRIRMATKKMEELVKQQLKDSGVLPSGKIKVKIVTSKDALEKMEGKNNMKLLSDDEENQFKNMILGLLGGSPDAGKERKRQQDLQNNYNLVWNEDELQTVPREDDEADGEVEVESFY